MDRKRVQIISTHLVTKRRTIQQTHGPKGRGKEKSILKQIGNRKELMIRLDSIIGFLTLGLDGGREISDLYSKGII